MERVRTGSKGAGGIMFADIPPRPKFGNLLYSDPGISTTPSTNEEHYAHRNSSASVASYDRSPSSMENSPYNMSPWNQPVSPFTKSPWTRTSPVTPLNDTSPQNVLIGSIVREEGHIYSLATSDGLLYTGSDSKNIRVWKNQKEFSGFKSNSGLVKAIVISGEKIFTGHQDGKIRVWKVSPKNPTVHKRAGTLPTFKALIKSSLKPSNYVEVRRHRNVLWIKHFDAVSCLSLNEDQGLLYSGSWDKTLKVWRISDAKCLESINVHSDAVNAVVTGFNGLIFTGSADGTIKVWRREIQAKGTLKHSFLQTLLKLDVAVTALAINGPDNVVYSGSSDGLVNFWEREKDMAHGGVLKGHKMALLCLAASGDLLFSGSADKTICVWRRENGIHTCLSILTGHSGPVKCLAVDKDESSTEEDKRWIVYSGSLDKSVKVWKVFEQAREQVRDLDKTPSVAKNQQGESPSNSMILNNPTGR